MPCKLIIYNHKSDHMTDINIPNVDSGGINISLVHSESGPLHFLLIENIVSMKRSASNSIYYINICNFILVSQINQI